MSRPDDEESSLREELAALMLRAATLFHKDPCQARHTFLEARRVALRLGDRTEGVCALMGAAHVDRSTGDRTAARRLYKRSAREAPEFTPAFRTLALVETELANELVEAGEIKRGISLYASAARHHRHAAELLEREGASDVATERELEQRVLARLMKLRGTKRG
jgi:hypothetical protein